MLARFSRAEVVVLLRQLSQSGAPPPCLRCATSIALVDFDFGRGGIEFYRLYRCPGCRRHLFVLEIGSDRNGRARAPGKASKPRRRRKKGLLVDSRSGVE